jgi:hypothetical protein
MTQAESLNVFASKYVLTKANDNNDADAKCT